MTILKNIFFLLAGLLCWAPGEAQVFVDQKADGNNDGSSWQHAFLDLQDAISAAAENDQIWVAGGTYLPGKPGDPRTATFHLTTGIQLYGGFAGTESSIAERDPANFPTVLSGDLNEDDIAGDFETNRSDNVYTVMLIENQSLSIPVIDGFVFAGGHADGDEEPFFEKDGGGLFSFGPVEVRNCEFRNNYAGRYGGALYHNLGKENTLKTYITGSFFKNNKSKIAGGAIYNELPGSNGTIIMETCDFQNNEAEVGAAVLNSVRQFDNEVFVNNCQFSGNKSLDELPKILTAGGALRFSVQKESSGFSGFVRGCTFSNNSTALHGGGISTVVHRGSKSTMLAIDSCFYRNNEAGTGGGVAINLGGEHDSLLIKNCSFQNNSSAGAGAAISVLPRNQANFTKIHDCEFSGNKTGKGGTAVYYEGDDEYYELKNCAFEINQTAEVQELINTKPVFDPFMLFLFIQGALWLQILYSLLMFFMTREKTTLYYTLLMTGLSMIYFYLNDYSYFPATEELFKIPIIYILFPQLSLLLVIISFIKFTQYYLNIDQFYPAFKQFIFYFIITFLVIDLVWIITILFLYFQKDPFWVMPADILYQIAIFIGLLIPFLCAILVARKGFKPAKFLLPALFLLAIGGLLILLYVSQFFLLGKHVFLIGQGFTLLALVAIALANGYRTNLLKTDRERAKRLAELDIAKTRLYNNITHEFRTPLTVIMGSAEMLRGNEQEKQLIQRNSKQLLQLINQMLDLSKLEGGALKLESKQSDIIPFIEYLVESFQSLAAAKHISLTFYTELEELEMDYDAAKIQAIISNLISNAIKFTPKSGKVVLHARTETLNTNPHLVLIVRDSGAGIPEKDIPYIFDRFFQVDASDMRRSEGSGIGLALVKELVHLMKGNIQVTSKPEKGSVFTVRIPITRVGPLQSKGFKKKEIVAAMVPPATDENTPSFFPPTDELPLALIIEDNRDVVSFLRSCLQRKYQLEVAYNGREGIEKALEIIPDIIISDVMMPEADGYMVCETLKADERTSHVPIILLTAKATQEDKIKGLDVGADAYLNKPFHREELEVRLQKLIELRQALQARFQVADNGVSAGANKEDDFIQKLRSIIEDKMEEESFGITELCRSVGLSRMQVHRKLKALTGMPTSAFINSIRLRKGYQLLSETEYNVSEVAYQLGFPDPSYFTRLFVKQFGKKPSEINKKG